MYVFGLRLASVLAAIILGLGGCAAIGSDREPATSAVGEPATVALTITDRYGARIFRGTTPATVKLDTGGGYFDGRAYMVAVTLEGHAPQTVSLGSELNAWYVGNVASGGPIGLLIVDPSTGAMWKLDRRHLDPRPRLVEHSHRPRVQVLALADVPLEARTAMVRVAGGGRETLPAGFSAADETE